MVFISLSHSVAAHQETAPGHGRKNPEQVQPRHRAAEGLRKSEKPTRYNVAKSLAVSSKTVGDQRGIIGVGPHDDFHDTNNICLEQGFGGDNKALFQTDIVGIMKVI